MTTSYHTARFVLVYVASPYRSPTEWGLRENIHTAAQRCVEVWKLHRSDYRRVMPISPVLNSAYFGGVVPDSVFLDNDLELLRRCDMLLTAGVWAGSTGVVREIAFAEEYGIPVVHSINALIVELTDL